MALNERQHDAVWNEDGDLMVSASAGSGKTYSLCMRILRELKEGKRSLDRLLIVTFTKSAAADLQRKLGKELREAIKNETNEEMRALLTRQKDLLPAARISTIDSFCYDLVKENFAQLGVSPGMRVAEKTEIASLKNKLMKKAVEKLCKNGKKELLQELFGNLSPSYNDPQLYDKLVSVYDGTCNLVRGAKCFKDAAEAMRLEAASSFENGPHGRVIVENCREMLAYNEKALSLFIELCGDAMTPKTRDVIIRQRERNQKALLYVSDPAAQTRALDDGYVTERLSWPRGHVEEPTETFFKTVRQDLINDSLRPDPKNRGYDTAVRCGQEFYLKTAELADCVYELFEEFGKTLFERKKKSAICEFSDLERMTYGLLYDESGNISAYASRLAAEYDELYIDEYQDVNEIQDRIFTALKRNNRYIVGDIKQSIYAFRGARPSIFNELRGGQREAATKKIYFNENFRSSRQILRFVNAAIGPVMRAGTEMNYLPDDDLFPNAELSKDGPLPTLCYVQKNDLRWAGQAAPEAVYTAKSVKRIMESGVKGRDIAVLVRSNNSIPLLQEAFKNEGIETESNFRTGFFETPEILLVRSLVELLDNPTKDICLAGAMRSPAFGFSLDDLARVRLGERSESLFASVNAYANKGSDPALKEKCRTVLEFISANRRAARTYPVDTVIYRMMDSLELLPLLTAGKSADESESVKENLLAFYDIVRSLCASGARDPGRLVRRLNYLSEVGKLDLKAPPEVPEDHVRIMTIHASKGLEFEVCWLYGCSKTLFVNGTQGFRFSENSGLVYSLRDPEIPWLKEKTPIETAFEITSKKQVINEEMRLLYVALTRAINRLYVSCTLTGGKSDEVLETLKYCPPSLLDMRLLVGYASYIKWLHLALGTKSDLYDVLNNELPEFSKEEGGACPGQAKEKTSGTQDGVPDPQADPALVGRYRERMDFTYAYGAIVDLPVKKSVSRLSPSVLDEEAENGEEDESLEKPAFASPATGLMPRFYAEGKNLHTAAEAARKGTATHAFMQFCDFKNLKEQGFEAEIGRLTANKFLSGAMASDVEKRAVLAFLESRLFSRLERARNRDGGAHVFREQRFMISMPASDFTAEAALKEKLAGEDLLVQGVIDCFFEEEDGRIVLFDYKTDHFTREQLRARESCRRELIGRHKTQLSYYREAVRRMMGREVDQTYIYSFSLDEEIEVVF